MHKIETAVVRKAKARAIHRHSMQTRAELTRQRLGDAGALTDFGAPHAPAARPLVEPAPRHWDEDEFLDRLGDEVALIEDGGEATVHADDRAAFRNARQ